MDELVKRIESPGGQALGSESKLAVGRGFIITRPESDGPSHPSRVTYIDQ